VFILRDALVTERLRLRPFRADDAAAVFATRSNPEVTRYLLTSVSSPEEVPPLIAKRASQTTPHRDDDALALAVERVSDGRVIGEVTLWLRSVEHRQGEVGFVFDPIGQGQGFAREAAERLLTLGFNTLGLHRVYGRTDLRNTSSAGLLGRLGMQKEAHLRHNEFFAGAWSDELVFGILEDEWRARHAAD
jgi:RimJ/RimL family protein N-acetyltransferase